jgi:ribonuclease HI
LDLDLDAKDDQLSHYRRLCEAVGFARGHGVRLAPAALEALEKLESELRDRLNQPARQNDDREQAPAPAVSPIPPPALAPASRASGPLTATVFCDGACQGNPGPGGYGVIVRCAGTADQELSGGQRNTTNNQMELTGALVGLQAASACSATDITIITDSEYLVKGMTQWLPAWVRRGWKTASGTPVKNRELWERLHAACQGRNVRWQWTRGHAGHPENERCDRLAVEAAQVAARRGSG